MIANLKLAHIHELELSSWKLAVRFAATAMRPLAALRVSAC